MVPLCELFEITYGNQLNLNSISIAVKEGINFVGRSEKNLGVVAQVEKVVISEEVVNPFEKGLITVALGGSVLSSFVQPKEFYTGQNIKVLKSKKKMSFNEKLYYCLCIVCNQYRYSSHGREANKSLDSLLVPKRVPLWVKGIRLTLIKDRSVLAGVIDITTKRWKWFCYKDLFRIVRGKGARKFEVQQRGKTPVITSIDSNNGVCGYVARDPTHPGNVITVNRNGSIGEAFYQENPFCSTEDVHVFIPKFELNKYIAMFLITLIKQEKYRYSYGRKWGIKRMKDAKMKLPIIDNETPDWEIMERYIQSLNYSLTLETQ